MIAKDLLQAAPEKEWGNQSCLRCPPRWGFLSSISSGECFFLLCQLLSPRTRRRYQRETAVGHGLKYFTEWLQCRVPGGLTCKPALLRQSLPAPAEPLHGGVGCSVLGDRFSLPCQGLTLVLQGTLGALLLLFRRLWGNEQPQVRERERKVRSKDTQKHNSEFTELG